MDANAGSLSRSLGVSANLPNALPYLLGSDPPALSSVDMSRRYVPIHSTLRPFNTNLFYCGPLSPSPPLSHFALTAERGVVYLIARFFGSSRWCVSVSLPCLF